MHQTGPHNPGDSEGPGPLSGLERAVLDAMLAGAAPELTILRDQLAEATVISRTHSGVGFVTRIAVPDGISSLPEAVTPRLRAIVAEHADLVERAEFLLQLRGGRLAVLEAYCYEGGWPADESGFRVVS